MGDTNGFPGRVKAGTAEVMWRKTGGIVSGDTYPNGTPWYSMYADTSGRDFPPYTIWEGDLIQGSDEVVFLTPTIWELDNGSSSFQAWIDWQVDVNAKYGEKAKEIVGGLYPVANPIFDAVSLGIQTFASLSGMWNIMGNPMSRPIGLHRDPSNPNGSTFNPMIIPLTYDLAEYLVNSNLTGKGPGIITHRYDDDPYLRGDYQIWLQIKKIGVPPEEITLPDDGFLAKEASNPAIYVIYGGAKFWIPNMETLDRLYGGAGMVNTVSDGRLNRFGAIPKDGTILREESSAYVWVMEAGKKRWITTPNVLNQRYGGWGKVMVVPDFALANIPTGQPIEERKILVRPDRPEIVRDGRNRPYRPKIPGYPIP